MSLHSGTPKNRRSLSIDLQRIQKELRWLPSVAGSDVLGSLDDLYRGADHRYRRIDDFTLLHVMDYVTLQPYELHIERPDLLCVQIMLEGKYTRLASARLQPVASAMTYITNYPHSVSKTHAGQMLRGIWVACDRHHFVTRYGLRADRIPPDLLGLFQSAAGMPAALELPTHAANIAAAQEILSCRLPEPLNSLYVGAKVTEILCNVVKQLHSMPDARQRRRMTGGQTLRQAIEAAAEIYRRGLDRPPGIEELARRVGINRNELTAGFKAQFGLTPSAFSVSLRMKEARALLDSGKLSISEVARQVGYSSYASFAHAFRAYYGEAPAVTK